MRSLCLTLLLLFSSLAPTARAADEPLLGRQWTVNGLRRTAILHVPAAAKSVPAPVVFVFHGHGGAAEQAARMFHIHGLWPKAIVVYMQGVPTPSQLVDPEGKRTGWQVHPGTFGDRDLHFFDAVLQSLHHDYHVDDTRVFATGHSNGGVFTYFLWAQRGDVFAGVAPSAAITAPENFARLKPKPVFHAAGEKDALIKFAWQKELIERLVSLNGCSPEGQKLGPRTTRYASPDHDTPVIAYIHDGGHRLPPEEPAAIVRFFKACAQRAAAKP